MTKEQTNSWEEELKEIIDGDWELMELNPGRPYRTGMKEVHFIKLKVLISKEKEKWVEEMRKMGDTFLGEIPFKVVVDAEDFGNNLLQNK